MSSYQKNKSVVFISFHKCASRLFSNYVLRNTKNLVQVDYQKLSYQNKKVTSILYEPTGYVYGVVRVLEKNHPLFLQTSFLLDKKNLDDKKILFLIRDPRDIIVSMYYSFGFTHGFSANEQIRKFQEQRRNKIRKMTIDEYAIKEAHSLRDKFEVVNSLRNKINSHILLKYEDIIDNYDVFYRQLNEFIPLNDDMQLSLFKRTRPQKEEQLMNHKRSGIVGGYNRKLRKDTIGKINTILRETLHRFNYEQADDKQM
jgi:hypothetical protein